jgi:hypothetical protein
MIFIKHLEKILSVFGRYLISMNILPPAKEEVNYANSFMIYRWEQNYSYL